MEIDYILQVYSVCNGNAKAPFAYVFTFHKEKKAKLECSVRMYRNWHICTLQYNEGGEYHLNHHRIHLILDFRNVFHTLLSCECASVYTICTQGARIDACYGSDNKMNHPDNQPYSHIHLLYRAQSHELHTHISLKLLNQSTLKFAQAYHSIEATYQIVSQNTMHTTHAHTFSTHLLLLAQYAIK